MATTAVFIAIGGGAYAAGLAKNSVGSKQIKPNAVKSSDVKNDSLTGRDIREEGLNLPEGPQGPRGLPGPQGPAGPAGSDGSPDTGTQILGKLASVDGAGSGLDADSLDGIDSGEVGTTASDSKTLTRPSGSGSFRFAPLLTFPGGMFEAQCGNEGGATATRVVYRNMTNAQQQAWTSERTTALTLNPGGGVWVEAGSGNTAKEATVLVSASDGTMVSATIGQSVTTATGGDCLFAIQATSTS
jgi:hypothetical protein